MLIGYLLLFLGESPNFFFFDKCPTAGIHFLKDYLEALDVPLINGDQVQKAFKILSEIDPLERIKGFQSIVNTSKTKSLIKNLLLFLHGIVSKSSDPSTTLSCMVSTDMCL